VERVALGDVMAKLNSMPGVADFHVDFDRKQTASGKPNGHAPGRKPPGRFELSGEQAILHALHGKPPMTAPQLADAFSAQGRSPKSISSCLHKLRTDGLISSTSDGYSLTKKARDRMRNKKKKK
jgi:hypothetical protein